MKQTQRQNQNYLEQRGWVRTHIAIPWMGEDIHDAYVPPASTPETTAAGHYLLTDTLGEYRQENLEILANRFEQA